jgi:hypothetical protein
MNGRVYDYRLGRFLSVDPLIGSSSSSQSINPYSYGGNNPLSGVDPTGYAFFGGDNKDPGKDGGLCKNESSPCNPGRGAGTIPSTQTGNGATKPSAVGNANPSNSSSDANNPSNVAHKLQTGTGDQGSTSPTKPGIAGERRTGGSSSDSSYPQYCSGPRSCEEIPVVGTRKSKGGLYDWFWGYYGAIGIGLDWARGTGPRRTMYGAGTVQTVQMQRSPGIEQLRKAVSEEVSQNLPGTLLTVHKDYHFDGTDLLSSGLNGTLQVVGSYQATAKTTADGTIMFTITNVTGVESFLHFTGEDIQGWPRTADFSLPFGNVEQRFTWTEPVGGTTQQTAPMTSR